MERMLIGFFNCETKEEEIRPMNDEEHAQYLIDKSEAEKQVLELETKQAEIDAAKTAISAKLVEMGITPELIEIIKKL